MKAEPVSPEQGAPCLVVLLVHDVPEQAWIGGTSHELFQQVMHQTQPCEFNDPRLGYWL